MKKKILIIIIIAVSISIIAALVGVFMLNNNNPSIPDDIDTEQTDVIENSTGSEIQGTNKLPPEASLSDKGCFHIKVTADNICEACGANVGNHTHKDTKRDGNHWCDYCNYIMDYCFDLNKDHICDECGAAKDMHLHRDFDGDGEHVCNYCKEVLTECKDKNSDHRCEECGEIISLCVDTDFDKSCDVCHGLMQYVILGSYPQTDVSGIITLSQVLTKKAGTLPTDSNSQAWTSYGNYSNESQNNHLWYIDIEYQGEKYRGVYFSPQAKNHKNYKANNVYWFKYEPIKWSIISTDEENGTAIILSNIILDQQRFDYDDPNNNYAESTIRKWLNETFYDTAFTDAEKQVILTTVVDNGNSAMGTAEKPCDCDIPNTEDKVFLLSYTEATNADYGLGSADSRQKAPSAYAIALGASPETGTGPEAGYSYWFLRTHNSYHDYSYADSDIVDAITSEGKTTGKEPNGWVHVSPASGKSGIVPAIQIKLR